MEFKPGPLVSFLVATYNRADLLRECIESILAQDYKNIEVIVIDDASRDNTESMINNRFNGKVKYYKNEVNRGVAYSRNLGLSMACGKYIGLLDSDDLLLERDCVELAVKILEEHPEVYIFTSDAYCIDLKGNKVYEKTFFQVTIDHRDIELFSGIKDFDYVFCHGIHSCGAIFRKDITQDLGFLNINYRIAWDEDFFLRLSAYKPNAVYYYNRPLTGYRHHSGNISNNSSGLYLEKISCRQEVLRRNRLLKEKLGYRANRRLAEQYLCLIDAYLKEGNIAGAIAVILKALFLYPLIFPRLVKHGLVFSGKMLGAKR